jgi:low affinity Fe/Cu permease
MTKPEKQGGLGNGFQTFATRVSFWMGTKWSFAGAILIIVVWAALGPYFHYSNTWQLVVNTATTIVTFLMVFLIQNTQNRDARAIHLKLDEVIRAMRQARNEMIDIENLSDEELEAMSKTFESIRLECEARKKRNANLLSHHSS